MKDYSSNTWLAVAILFLAAGQLIHSFSSKHHKHDEESQLNPMVSEASYAMAICKDSGGEALITEYNSQTGLTINCFYPGDKLEKLDSMSDEDL